MMTKDTEFKWHANVKEEKKTKAKKTQKAKAKKKRATKKPEQPPAQKFLDKFHQKAASQVVSRQALERRDLQNRIDEAIDGAIEMCSCMHPDENAETKARLVRTGRILRRLVKNAGADQITEAFYGV